MTNATKPRRIVRTTSVQNSAWAAAILSLVFAVAAVAADRTNVVFVVGAVFMAGLGMRIRTMGVHIRSDDIRVVGFVSSTRVPWADIERFDVERYGRYPYVAHIVRRSVGRHVPILAITAPAHPESRLEEFRLRVQGQVDELNRVLEEQTHSASPARPTDPTTVEGFIDQLR